MRDDPQKHQVYKATGEAETPRKLNPVECQLLAQGVRDHPVLRAKYEVAMSKRIKIVLKKDSRISAYAFWDMIFLPKWAQTDWTICHEIAHVVHNRTGAVGHESHGPEFCRINLDIVEHMLGELAAEILRAAFDRHDVSY